ncbi:DUF6777 domain-containing protein [Streptomyces sp. NPDC050997]|uniref:DUF6777 domain-containing protein n=1 Tax=Streptomyces sp. NPDC050997 TaxID=3155519 RepID=UPI00342F26ED
MVKAVAVGVPSLAPFFDEHSGLGQDAQVRSRPAHGGLQQGDTPGLYGGSKQPTLCDVERLEQFLTDPANERKAQAWARALGIAREEIPDYLERLTPVLLRHDTLVKNHDYKKGKAVPYDSLLQAGIAILVDPRGLPAAKCSCGNPLRPFQGDTSRISVRFEDGNKKWRGYERSSVVAVRPASRTLDRIALVDVHTPERGINRPVGTTGEDDSAFDTRKRRAVPNLAGTTFGQASRRLADAGLAAGYDGQVPPDAARVTATDPPAGTELRFGEYVTLSVAGGESGRGQEGTSGVPPEKSSKGPSVGPSEGTSGGTTGGTTTPPSSGSSGATSTPPPSSDGPKPPSSGTSGTPGMPGTSPGSQPPASDPPPGSRPPSPDPPPASEPAAASPPADAPPASVPPASSPPQVTSARPPSDPPPPGTPVTTSAPPPTSAPVTSEPAGSEPASGEPTVGAFL